MKKNVVRAFAYVFTFLVFFSTTASIVSSPVVSQSLEDELRELEEEIRAIEDKQKGIQDQIANKEYIIEGYNSQVSALYGEVLVFQDEIDKLELQLKELELNIELLGEQIEEKREEISRTETAIDALELESDNLIKSHYYDYRMYGGDVDASSVLETADIADFYKDSQYKELIQSDTNELMARIADLRIELEQAKLELDERMANIAEEKKEVEAKRKDVDIKKSELDVKIAAFQAEEARIRAEQNALNNQYLAFSEEQIQKEAEAESIRNAIFNSFTPIEDGEYIAAGRPIGNQGCTGLCTGPHLHFMVWQNGGLQNPCSYISACGGSGLEMPIQSSYTITSYFGERCFNWGGSLYCDFHNAVDLAANPWNAVVYSAHKGYAYRGTDPYGALYVIVCETAGCQSGFKTGYWHLSSF